MPTRRSLIVVLLIILCLATFGWLLTSRGAADLVKNYQGKREVLGQGSACVFLQSPEVINGSAQLAAAYKTRAARETYGYASDTPLSEAVKIFNDEMRCYSFWATLPQLTEEEVSANVIGGPDYGVQWPNQQRQALNEIASKKVMPKGSLFAAESGGCDADERPGSQTCVKGLKIYLFLGLDKNPRASKPLNADQIVLLRKTYFQIESRN
jgi:hypothetical protein